MNQAERFGWIATISVKTSSTQFWMVHFFTGDWDKIMQDSLLLPSEIWEFYSTTGLLSKDDRWPNHVASVVVI
jgi:hypothetical protein